MAQTNYRTIPKTVRGPRRRALHALLAVATVIVLSACGARIDTTMTVAGDGSGSRVMVLTLTAEDTQKLAGGMAAVEASVQKNLPAQLDYSGLQGAPDGGISLTFTLAFDNPAEYHEKAQALLALGGDESTEVDFVVTDSLLLKGIDRGESFTSYGLVKWMFDGLLADGIVPAENATDMYEIGDTVLNFDGDSVSLSGRYIYSDVLDNGFTSVSMQTDIADPDAITRRITFTVDAAQFAASDPVYEEYFAAATPDGADLVATADGSWEMTFSGDAAALASNTDQALSATGSTFDLESGTSADDPATLVTTVTETASCVNICVTGSGDSLRDTVTGAAEYTPAQADVDLADNEPVSFSYAAPIASVDADFTFGLLGSVTAAMHFVVATSDVARVGDGFMTLFESATDAATVTSVEGSTDTTFTAIITAADADAFAAAYAQWAPEATMLAVPAENSGVFTSDVRYVINPRLDSVLQGHDVVGATTTSVMLPFGQKPSASGLAGLAGLVGLTGGVDIDGSTVTVSGTDPAFSFESQGPTVAGFVLIGGLILAAAVGVLLLVRFRRPLVAKLQAVRANMGDGVGSGGGAGVVGEPEVSGVPGASGAPGAAGFGSFGSLSGMTDAPAGTIVTSESASVSASVPAPAPSPAPGPASAAGSPGAAGAADAVDAADAAGATDTAAVRKTRKE